MQQISEMLEDVECGILLDMIACNDYHMCVNMQYIPEDTDIYFMSPYPQALFADNGVITT